MNLILDLPASMPRGLGDAAAGSCALKAVARVAPSSPRPGPNFDEGVEEFQNLLETHGENPDLFM
jgi:hypothetical protein